MNVFVGTVVLLGVSGVVGAGTALAQPGQCSTLVTVINVVGRNASGVDSYGTFTLVIRDFACSPIANADVKLDFTNCTDGTLCLDAVEGAGTPDCSGTSKEVHATTDLAGRATFTIQGGRKAPAPTTLSSTASPPGPGAGCIQVFANGVPMANAAAVYVNQVFLDGSPVNGGDTSVEQREVICAALGGPYRARHDLQFNGAINGGDTAVM